MNEVSFVEAPWLFTHTKAASPRLSTPLCFTHHDRLLEHLSRSLCVRTEDCWANIVEFLLLYHQHL